MQQWLAFPWVRYVIWLLVGMLLAFGWPIGGETIQWLSLLLAMLYLASLVVLRQNRPAAQLVWGLLACSFLVSLGYWRTAEVLQPPQTLFTDSSQTMQELWIRVAQEPTETAKSYRFQGLVYKTSRQKSATEQETGAISAQVYVPKALQPPRAGELLLVKARLQPVPGPLNPHEFDNRAYLASQSIHHQLFVKMYVTARTDLADISFWQRVAIQSRRYLLGIVSSLVPDRQSAAVVKAMVLGQRSELDRALSQAYSDAGVMHVLAVSGLHVGIVFGLVYLLFPLVRRQWWQRVLWLLLALLVLWTYAWLTGLAPSAQRAAAMFTIIAIGKAIRRRGNIYNSIALSAFILLLWNPLLLLQVGFQLSYLAVIGIVYLQPRIRDWLKPEKSWAKKLWDLMSVTLAAQLATFPLGLYYFHQFPTYFFIGNLMAVPLAFLILYATLLLLVLHWVPVVNELLGWLVNLMAKALNFWVQLTEQLPLSKLVATITATETLLFYLALIAVLLLFRQRSFAWGAAAFALLLGLAGSGIARVYSLRQQQAVTLYHIPGHTLFHFVQGEQEAFVPLGSPPSERQLAYHVGPARLQAGFAPLQPGDTLTSDFEIPHIQQGAVSYFIWNGFKIAVIDGKLQPLLVPRTSLPIDLVLLRNNPKISLEQLRTAFAPEQLVLDASNSHWYRQKTDSIAKSLHLSVYHTSEQGAYHLQL